MGYKKGLTWTILGALALEYAAHETGFPGVTDIVSDLVHSGTIGEGIASIVNPVFDYYVRNMFSNKFATVGTAASGAMYGGLGNLIYNLVKSPESKKTE